MPLSIETPGEWDVVNELSGDHPTMQDNVGGAGQDGIDSFAQDKWDHRYAVCAAFVDDHNRRDNCTVIDAGAGEGHLHPFIKSPCTYIAVDVIDDLLLQIKDQIPGSVPLKAAAHSIPLADQSVDYIVCSESLEHYPDPTAGMIEFSRIVKKDGRIILTFPNAHRLRNPNLFHILIDLIGGRIFNGFLQPVVMHPNMWTNALTHHYDFTVRMVRDMAAESSLRIDKLGSIYFPIPYRGPLRRMAIVRFFEHVLPKIPLVRFFGSSMLVVLSRREV
jgi:ubiquinone/menaquinone biosynthesis C-methylase UbiE